MAEAKEEGTVEGAPKKKGKLMLFIIIGVVVLALAGAGGAFFLMKKKAAAEAEDGDGPATEEKAAKEEKHTPPVFVKLDPFTVRLQNEGQDSYLQATPELRVLDIHIGEKVKEYTPEIRHKALLVIASKTPADVSTPQGVEKLASELRVTINQIINPGHKKKKKKDEEDSGDGDGPAADDPVQAVLFTSFIVQ